MLVIRRRSGESVFIGEGIEIEILDIEGSQVKLGIRAPRSIPILRSEVVLTGRANRAASRQVSAEQLTSLASALRKEFSSNSSDPHR